MAQAWADVDAKMGKASTMLRNFLDEELSEAHVGISSGIRAHLEGFRGFLLSFYNGKFGYYPPQAFNAAVCRTMADDFAQLYALLKDEAFTCDGMMPSTAAGGICALQLVQSLDARLGHEPLQHPLPLLPQPEPRSPVRRASWLGWRASKSDTRLVEHAAMVKASNWRDDVFQNDLVRAYRRFEESLAAAPGKGDRQDRVPPAYARKVRWILIYAIHQTLRHVMRRPPGVKDDESAPYLLTAPVADLPPWTEPDEAYETDAAAAEEDLSLATQGSSPMQSPKGRIEIKPDIDYFALTQRESVSERRQSTCSVVVPQETRVVERFSSIGCILGSGSPFRRPARGLRPAKAPMAPLASSPCKPLYHEIVVHGYGNGTNDVSFDGVAMTRLDTSVKWARRSDSTASQGCSSVSSALASTASPVDSVATSVTTLGSPTPPNEPCAETTRRGSQQEASKTPAAAISTAQSNPPKRRPLSTAFEGFSYAKGIGQLVEQERRSMLAGASGLTRRHSTHAADPRRQGSLGSQAWPTNLPKHRRGAVRAGHGLVRLVGDAGVPGRHDGRRGRQGRRLAGVGAVRRPGRAHRDVLKSDERPHTRRLGGVEGCLATGQSFAAWSSPFFVHFYPSHAFDTRSPLTGRNGSGPRWQFDARAPPP